MERIDLNYIWQILLEKNKTLLIGQFITVITILVSIPIPLMLPALVDEVLLNKPAFFLSNINTFFGEGSAFYYIFLVTFAVIFLRMIHYILSIITSKIFTSIAKHVTFKVRQKLLLHLKIVSMNEYESLGSGAVTANLITDVNTLDNFIMTSASKLATAILTLIAVSIVIITIHPLLGLTIIITQPLVMYLSRKIASKTGQLKKEEFFFDKAINKANKIKDTSYEVLTFQLFFLF